MLFEHTYWNERGKHQLACLFLHDLIPMNGPVKDKKLDRFRRAANCYYDLYNNGLTNRRQEFYGLFRLSVTKGRFRSYSGRLEYHPAFVESVEAKMDHFIVEAAREQGIYT